MLPTTCIRTHYGMLATVVGSCSGTNNTVVGSYSGKHGSTENHLRLIQRYNGTNITDLREHRKPFTVEALQRVVCDQIRNVLRRLSRGHVTAPPIPVPTPAPARVPARVPAHDTASARAGKGTGAGHLFNWIKRLNRPATEEVEGLAAYS